MCSNLHRNLPKVNFFDEARDHLQKQQQLLTIEHETEHEQDFFTQRMDVSEVPASADRFGC